MARLMQLGAWSLLAGSALAGCGSVSSTEVTTGSSCSASQTTSPDWVFSLLISSGLVAFTSALIWAALLMAHRRPPPLVERRSSLIRALALVYLAWSGYTHRDMFTHEPDRTIYTLTLALVGLPTAGLYVIIRRYRATGEWPRPRNAPWGMFWLLPVMAVLAVSVAAWSVWTMIDSMVAVPC